MIVRTHDKVELWNRSRSMMGNGYIPSEIAKKLYDEFGVRRRTPSGDLDPERDQAVLAFFVRLVLPEDAPSAPTVFDRPGGHA